MSERKWIWVCVQHPMPLLVQDRGEPDVLERIPPWGDPDLKTYLKKFEDVFDSLDNYSDFRIDFEISARELEDVVKEDPAMRNRMAHLVDQGKVGFVGGDYSQSHCHVYGSESCIRQIIYGLRTFEELFDYRIDVFFHQETGIHDQLPQLLNAFGYKVAVPPRFPWALQFISGEIPEITSHYGVVEFVAGAEFTNWRGLDGSEIPLYLSMPAPSQSDEIIEVFQKHGNPEVRKEIFEGPSPFEVFMERERQKNPVTVPTILIENPDMKRLDEEYYRKRGEHCVFSLLGDALLDRLESTTVASSARLYAYWSYIEGVWAETMSRTNKQAETAALQAEALDCLVTLLLEDVNLVNFDKIWKSILSSQHHDIYWIETTEIKRQALGWLKGAIAEADVIARSRMKNIAESVDTTWAAPYQALLLFNTTAKQRAEIEHIVFQFQPKEATGIKLDAPSKGDLESQIYAESHWPDGSIQECRAIVKAEVPGLGYSAYALDTSPGAVSVETVVESEEHEQFEFENESYRAIVRGDGTFISMVHLKTGMELLETEQYFGNELRGSVDGKRIGNRKNGSSGTLQRGVLADIFSTQERLGSLAMREDILFYHRSNRIDFVLNLDFGTKGTSLGVFWEDIEKLNVYWPFKDPAGVFHDIPFGVIEAKENRPLYCTNWIDFNFEKAGVAYFNRGTTKHWINENVLANVLAWGGNWFSNRHPGIWEYVRKYDICLYGEHTIEYSLYVHDGDWRQGQVAQAAEIFSNPLRIIRTNASAGRLPPQQGCFSIQAPNVISTSFAHVPEHRKVVCRIFESHGHNTSKEETGIDIGTRKSRLYSLAGEQVDSLSPYRIAEIKMDIQSSMEEM